MINPLAVLRLPKQVLSPQALLTVAVAHVLVFWWALHGGQAVQATRQVVYQTFSPITLPREKKTLPIAPPAAAVKTPAALPAQVVLPVQPVESKTPAVITQRMDAVTPPRANFQAQELKSATDPRRSQEIPSNRLTPLAALPEPAVVEPSLPVPTQVAAPQAAAPLPSLAPSPVLPNLSEKLLPVPEVVAPAPAPAPAVAEAAATASPSPVQVPAAGPARSSAITPAEVRGPQSSSAGGAVGGSGANVVPAGSAAQGGTGTNYGIPGGGRQRQKSLSEMANEQLNPGGRKDKLTAAVDASERPDCVNSGQSAGLLAPAIVAYNVVRDKCK